MVPRARLQVVDTERTKKWLDTPLGWARANVFYDKLLHPPEPGTLVEMLCLIIWKARQSVALAGARAQAQASIGGKEAIEAFNDYRDLVNRVEREDKQKKMKQALDGMKNIKAIRVTPLATEQKPLGKRRKK